MKERRYDIDWLRVLATLTIFFFHCARFFDTFDWHIKNQEKSDFFTLFVIFLATWEMPLFFVISGFGSWYALKTRGSRQFLFERVKRLLIPFYTVGIFLVLPPQFYFDLITHGRLRVSYWSLIPPYWDQFGAFRFRFDEPYLTNLWPGHLWFLQFLFIVSLITLPVLLYLKTDSGEGLINKLAGWCHYRGVIFIFIIPLIIVRISLRHYFRGEHTWADLIEYSIYFLIGYLIATDKRFTESYKRDGWIAIFLGIIGFICTLYMFTELKYNPMEGEFFSQTYVLFQILWSVTSWSWIVFILSLGAKFLNFTNRVLSYGNEAVLPFYILHQTAILIVGWYVIPLLVPIPIKYFLIAIVSFSLIMGIYEVLIRRFNILRILFGMRLKKNKPDISGSPVTTGA